VETGKPSPAEADYRKRTFEFAARVVRFVEALPKSETNRVLGNQLLRSATSVGANARAAKRSRSSAEFISKMGIVEEEADETIYWIEMLVALEKVNPSKAQPLLTEASELLAIAISSIKTARKNAKTS
jgi:four helix bundle protein